MQTIHVTTVAEADGELHLSNLPVHKGDTVEAIVLVPDGMTDDRRSRAREDFLQYVRSSSSVPPGLIRRARKYMNAV